MGLFSNSTPFDEQLDKATNELNTETDWGLIISLCDKIKTTPNGASIVAPAILTKMNNKVPHVSMQAITVLDACINNCGSEFQKMVASSQFTDGLRNIVQTYRNATVTRRLRYFIRKWAEEFKEDRQLSRFVSFYYDLRGQGLDFPETENDNPSTKTEKSSHPDVASSQQEADDLAKAIEASLQEEKNRKGGSASMTPPTISIYPSVSGASGGSSYGASTNQAGPPRRKVKALYDFEAAEDNELTFKTGDIISILDDSDANWWKGEGANGAGLFPSNFVTSDLSQKVEEEKIAEKESTVSFNDAVEVKEVLQNEPVLQVDESLIDRTLASLQSTDPETTVTDPEELIRDEESCLQMGKLIDNELEDLDRKHLELSMLNEKILESLKMYDSLMKQAPMYSTPRYGPMTSPNPMMYPNNPAYPGSYMTSGQVAPQGMQMVPPPTDPSQMGPPPTHPSQMGPPLTDPSQMGPPPTHPSQGYNNMYQTAPGTGYATHRGGSGMPPVDPQQTQQNPSFLPGQSQQPSNLSYGVPAPQQASLNYPDGSAPPMMSQYQIQQGLTNSTQPSNYPTNQVTSQPLM